MYGHYSDIQAIQKNYEVIASNPIVWCKNVCDGDIVLPEKLTVIPNLTSLRK
jgi:hypothetical protein